MRALFVSNGHGEAAIVNRLVRTVRELDAQIVCDHLPLVGDVRAPEANDVGPRRAMPSGGLIAMGNVRNIVRDLRGGLLGLTLAQRRFLGGAHARYDACVAVGDVYALLMTLAVARPTLFVGTAKSTYVAPYGRFERTVLRRAARVFVRDEPTAASLRERGVDAKAPGNTIVDLFADVRDDRARDALRDFSPAIALFPGSRASAYDDGAFLVETILRVREQRSAVGAALSLAPQLDRARWIERLSASFDVRSRDDEMVPLEIHDARGVAVRAWCGEVGALLPYVSAVLGQAGTANEAAAAAGIPILAFERGSDRKTAWYRMRQSGLLGDALEIAPGAQAVDATIALLDDDARRARMGAVGKARMGAPGGSRRIAEAIVEVLHAAR